MRHALHRFAQVLVVAATAVCGACATEGGEASDDARRAISRPGWIPPSSPALTVEREGEWLHVRSIAGKVRPSIRLDAASAVLSLAAPTGERVTLTPSALPFEWTSARVEDGRIVYLAKDRASALVFTAQPDRIKEDIVLTAPIADALVLEWKVMLEGVRAALLPGGDLRLQRPDGAALFRMPAPIVVDAAGAHFSDRARFEWDGNILRMRLHGLKRLQYPISIDPTVQLSTSDFTPGHDEGGVSLASTGLQRLQPDLGVTGWSAAGTFASARRAHAAVASNGYLYVLGGWDGTTVRADVESAAFGGTGLQFANAGPMPGRRHHAAAAWNDRVYVVGGYDANGGPQATVLVAPLTANGGIGAFQTATALPSARVQHAAIAHAGHLYVIGGTCGSGTCPSTSVDVQYAPILPDGSLGAWSTTSTISARTSPGVAVLNGQLYVAGGQSSTTFLSDVLVAPILETGALGSFRATTSLPEGVARHVLVAARGGLYVAGGTTSGGASLRTTAAAILASGNVGRWLDAAGLPASREEATALSVNGRIYVVGGGTPTSTATSDVLEAAIGGQGAAEGFVTTQPLASARSNIALATWNRHVYVLGGAAGGSPFTDVFFARMRPDGTVDPWQATTPLLSGRESASAAAWGGYVYIAGGEVGQTPTGVVESAPILPNGQLGTWKSLAPLITARTELHVYAHDGYLYASGGCTKKSVVGCTSFAGVEYAQLLPGGNLGPWKTTTSLLSTRNAHFMGAYDGRLYVVAGASGNQELNSTEVATLNADGSVGAWSASAAVATTRMGLGGAVFDGRIYALGGWSGSVQLNDVQHAPILPTGMLGSWSQTSSFATGRAGHQAAAVDGNLFLAAGYSNTYQADVQVSPLRATGGTGGWFALTSLPSPRFNHAAVAARGYVYVLGGNDGSALLNDVWFAPIQADGSLGTWTATQSFATARERHRVVALGGRLYLLGGRTTAPRSDVQVATIGSNGTLSAWSSLTSMPVALEGHAAAARNNVLYVTGGRDGTGRRADVLIAAVDASGNITSWSSYPSAFAGPRDGHESFVYNAGLYVVGGFDGTNPLHDVQISALGTGGAPGAFARAAGMPGGLGDFAAGAVDGYAYAVGGRDNTGGVPYALVAPLTHAGRPGDWYFTQGLPSARDSHAAVFAGGRMYIVGGRAASGALSEVLVSPLRAPAQRGSYSRVIDLGADSTIATFSYDKATGRDDAIVSYRVAPDGASFGPWVHLGRLAGGVPASLAATGRHFWFRLALDESSAATAQPDDPATLHVTSFTLDYTNSSTTLGKLAFVTPSHIVPAGGCTGQITVQTQSSTGGAVPVAQATPVALTSTSGTSTFHTTSGCSGPPVSSVTIPLGGSQATFFLRDTTPGVPTITAAATSYTSTSQTHQFTAPPDRLVFTTGAQTAAPGQCSAAVRVETRDSAGNLASVTSSTTLTLTETGGLSFFTDPACGTSGPTVIPAGGNSATFYFTGTTAGAATLTVSATGLQSATQAATIAAGAPSVLAFTTAAQSVPAGQCSGVVTVESRDAYGNPAAVGTSAALTLTQTGGLSFFTDPTCATGGAVAIAAGTSSASFYFTGTVAGGATLTAAASGMQSATQSATIVPGAPAVLAITTPAQTVVAGACSGAVVVELRDTHGNATISMSQLALTITQTGGLSVFTDPSCGTAGAVVIPAGASGASFYFRGTAAGAATLTAAATGVQSATQPATIAAGAPAQLAFATAAQELLAGACSSEVAVELRDAFGNPASAATNTALSLSTDSTTATLFSDACVTGSTSVVIAAGQQRAAFFFRDTRAGTTTLTVGSPHPAVTQAQTIRPAAATKIEVTATLTEVPAGGTATVNATLFDEWANVAQVHTGTITLEQTGPGTLEISPSPTVTLANGAASWTVRGTSAGTYALVARATGLPDAATALTVRAGPPHHASLSAAGSPALVGTPIGLSLQVRDEHENPVAAQQVEFSFRASAADCSFQPPSALSNMDGAASTSVACPAAGPVEVCADAPALLQPAACATVSFDLPEGSVRVWVESGESRVEVGSRVDLLVRVENTSAALVHGLSLLVNAEGGELAQEAGREVPQLAGGSSQLLRLPVYVTGPPHSEAMFGVRVVDAAGREVTSAKPVSVMIEPVSFHVGGCGCGATTAGSAWPVAALLIAWAARRRSGKAAQQAHTT